MIGHYGLVSRHLVWADPFSYEEHKYRAEYFRMCYEILKDYKTDKPEFTEHKKVLAVQFFMSYVRCSEQQMLSFESCGNAYMNPRLNTEEKPQYIKSNEFYGCPTGPH